MPNYRKNGTYLGNKQVSSIPVKITGTADCRDRGRTYYRIIGTDRKRYPPTWVRSNNWVGDSGWDVRATSDSWSTIQQLSKVRSHIIVPTKKDIRRELLLVDGNNVAMRSYYAMPGLRSEDGHPTGAIKGLVHVILSMQQTFSDANLVFCFDAPGRKFRNDLYEDYKKGRVDKDAEFTVQMEPIKKIVTAFGIPIFEREGIEADDLLATLSRTHSESYGIILGTTDKDLAQLIGPRVSMWDLAKHRRINSKKAAERWGIPPRLMKEYLMLTGDSVDNIPGVKKCGPKTAVKWLKTYKSLAGIIKNAGEIGGVVGENLKEHLPKFELTESLVRLYDVDMDTDLRFTEPDLNVLGGLLKKYEIRVNVSANRQRSLF